MLGYLQLSEAANIQLTKTLRYVWGINRVFELLGG